MILLALAVLVLSGNARADEPKLTGSAMKEEDAIANSDAVFVGKVTSIGGPYAKGVGPNYYPIGIDVGETYLGSVVSNPYSWTTINRSVEHLPSVGKNYIFFVKKQEGRELMPLKFLPASDANIATVKKLIAQLPAK